MNKRYIPLLTVMIILAIFSGSAFGQKKQQQKTVTIESVIKDNEGTPIPNAVISVKEGAIETLSDAEGRFSIQVPENSEILIEAEGFDAKLVPLLVASQGVILNKVPFLMDEANMVSIPFGKIRNKETVGALSTISPGKIAKYDNTQWIFDALRSRIPGLLGDQNIRGIDNAVIVVDGIPRDASNINLEEIDQITVLKDANSSILYGTQAKNGIILVTTKRGQSNKRIIDVSLERGFSKPITYPKYLNSSDYMTLYNEALVNDALPAAYPDSIIARYADGLNPYRYPSVDYYSSEFLISSRPFFKLLSEFSGGNVNTQYYANMGWIHTGSLYKLGEGKEADIDRFNMRANVSVKLNDYIKALVDAIVIFELDKQPNGSFWSNAATLQPHYFSPLLPVKLIKSNATYAGGASKETAVRVNGDYILGGTSAYTNNVYGNMFLSGYTQNIQRKAQFNNGFEVDLKWITQGLKFNTYLTFDILNRYNQNVTDQYAIYAPTWQTNPGGTDSISALTKVGSDVSTGVQNLPYPGMSYVRRIGTYAMFDYARTFNGVHSITGTMLGYYDTYRRNGVVVDVKNSHLGLRLTYDYKKKYLIDFSSAYVNGFKLEPGNKGGFSPSVGIGWVLSDENFLSGNTFVDYLKLRASAGIINTEFPQSGTGFYSAYRSNFVEGTIYYWNDGSRSVTAVNASWSNNPNLTFEKMKKINFGLEGYFFKRTLYIDANVFKTKYSDQVVQRTMYPAYLVFNRPYENYNETDFKGADAGITYSKAFGDFSFSLGATYLISNSKRVLRDEIWTYDYQYRQGRANDVMFGLEAIGFFPDSADIAISPVQQFGEVKPGDLKYKDQNNDNKIDANDEVQIGHSQARNAFGLNLLLKYKNISLFAIGNGRQGSQAIYSGNYFWVQGSVKYSEEILNRWTPATVASATYPRLSSRNSPNNFRNSTFWLYQNEYFTLDRVQLTYELPKNISRKVSSKEILIYLRGENLARFSKDADKRQIQIGAEPLYRNYALGVRLGF